MNCTKCEVLLHALIDGELDAGHTSDVETHVETCSGCTGKLKMFRAMREAMAGADLKWTAPAHLRRCIEAALPLPLASASAQIVAPRKFLQPSRRTFFGGFGLGTALPRLLPPPWYSLCSHMIRSEPLPMRWLRRTSGLCNLAT